MAVCSEIHTNTQWYCVYNFWVFVPANT